MDWTRLLLFALLSAGNAELMVVLVNRLHALPIPCRTLRHVRHLHDLLIPGFPLLLVWSLGFRGPQLLVGGNWSDVPLGWTVYLALCALGVLSLLSSVIRHLFRRAPATLLSNHTRLVDVADELGTPPIGDGPFRWLIRVPGNQVFEISVATKHLTLPRLPREWNGLSILHLSDWHFIGTIDKPFFERASELASEQNVDLIVFTGDLLDQQDLAAWIPGTLGSLSAPLGCCFILGNHDWYLDPRAISAALQQQGWVDVMGRVASINHRGRRLLVGGTAAPWIGDHPDFSAAARDAHSNPALRDFRLLLSHTPDHLRWAQSEDVDLMLAGHNHGGQVVLPLIGPVYSPSLTGCRFAGGLFEDSPTVLHVSRGLSGRHPLRINCRPEITKIVLHSPEPGSNSAG